MAHVGPIEIISTMQRITKTYYFAGGNLVA